MCPNCGSKLEKSGDPTRRTCTGSLLLTGYPSGLTGISTEETMAQQLGARGNDRDQHQLLERLRRNFIAHMLSDVHAEHDWQQRSRRD